MCPGMHFKDNSVGGVCVVGVVRRDLRGEVNPVGVLFLRSVADGDMVLLNELGDLV